MKKLQNALKQLIIEHDLNPSVLGRLTGVLQPVLHRMLTGETDNPRIDTLLPIAQYFNVTLEQLTGITPLHNKDKNIYASVSQAPLLSWPQLIPHIDAQKKSSDKIYYTHQKISEKAYALPVKDSTMVPIFQEAAWLLVEPELKPANKDFVIVDVETYSEPILRQIYFDGDEVHLKPTHHQFKTLMLQKDDHYRFLGVVIETKHVLKNILEA